jgi:hypothetical protein
LCLMSVRRTELASVRRCRFSSTCSPARRAASAATAKSCVEVCMPNFLCQRKKGKKDTPFSIICRAFTAAVRYVLPYSSAGSMSPPNAWHSQRLAEVSPSSIRPANAKPVSWRARLCRTARTPGTVHGSPKSRPSIRPADAKPVSWRVRLCRTARAPGTVNGSPKSRPPVYAWQTPSP